MRAACCSAQTAPTSRYAAFFACAVLQRALACVRTLDSCRECLASSIARCNSTNTINIQVIKIKPLWCSALLTHPSTPSAHAHRTHTVYIHK